MPAYRHAFQLLFLLTGIILTSCNRGGDEPALGPAQQVGVNLNFEPTNTIELPNYLYHPAPSTVGNAPTANRASDAPGFSGFQPSYNIDFRSTGGNGSLNSASHFGP